MQNLGSDHDTLLVGQLTYFLDFTTIRLIFFYFLFCLDSSICENFSVILLIFPMNQESSIIFALFFINSLYVKFICNI